jgi:hypothetical protein
MVFPMALGFSLKGIFNRKEHKVTQSSRNAAHHLSFITRISSFIAHISVMS